MLPFALRNERDFDLDETRLKKRIGIMCVIRSSCKIPNESVGWFQFYSLWRLFWNAGRYFIPSSLNYPAFERNRIAFIIVKALSWWLLQQLEHSLADEIGLHINFYARWSPAWCRRISSLPLRLWMALPICSCNKKTFFRDRDLLKTLKWDFGIFKTSIRPNRQSRSWHAMILDWSTDIEKRPHLALFLQSRINFTLK